MKHRIMSRVEIARVILSHKNRDEIDGRTMNDATSDMLLHLLHDGSTVIVRNDVNMGGTIVEIPD